MAGVDATQVRRGCGAAIQTALRAAGIRLPDGHRLVTLAERPDLVERLETVGRSVWPEFLEHDAEAHRYWHHLREDFAEFQLMLLDPQDSIAALARSAPLQWNGTSPALPEGWGAQLAQSVADYAWGERPDTLGSLMIVVHPARQGQRLGSTMVAALRALAAGLGYSALIACVRPSEKAQYPLTSIDDYAAWRRADGLPYDPWVRTHVRLGGRIVRASPRSMTVVGTVAQWATWTGMEFPGSGEYIVPDAGAVVAIDCEADLGVHHDPDIWVVHELSGYDGAVRA